MHNIQEDAHHNIWASTSNGVCLVLANLSTIHLTYRDGLQGNEFADGAGYAANGGRVIYFGGTKGMNAIDISKMHSNGAIPPLTLQEIAIDGKKAAAESGIRLGVKARSIRFFFSIPDYINNDRCLLFYSLIRKTLFSTDEQPNWQMGASDKTVTLNELPPGDYVLKVRQSNFSQQRASRCMEIPFHVDYPLWQRWWAVAAYIIALSVIIRSVYLSKKKRLIKIHKRELEKQGERTREEIYHAKLRFFSSVTSAFSSNITQIFDALNNIRKNPSGSTEQNLSIIDQNIRSMSTHIRQISEIRSTEENLPLTPVRVNLYDMLITSTENYVERMLKAGVSVDVDEALRGIEVATDRKTFSKALSYLLEYVFQNIADGSELSVRAKVCGNGVEMAFAYQGTGPSEEELTEIFNSHKAVDQFENNQAGVGRIIGVTISNSLLKRLSGGLSITRSGGREDHLEFRLTLEQMELAAPERQPNDTVVDRIIRNKDKRVWLIKCDPAMMDFARRALVSQYDIVVSGLEEALEKGSDEEVDLIICGLSGQDNAFIARLRTDLHTKYVPIVAICDEGARESYAEVLTMGVNTLIERPFTAQYLKTVVDHSVLDTQRMRDFSTSTSAYTQRFDALGLSEKDRKFIYQTVDTLRQHFSDEGYTPDLLAKDLAISRSQLYRKMRELTQASPGDFILEYRLVHAELLLKTTELTVSEIINACGFRNRSFFYREFGRRNHCLPMEFRKKETKHP
ncbi:MAG: helix-turn-helix domain-containing protein [Prevotella sp.]|nr:helix-turn-helix domain-containing protein [Bacteroidales bacterium]MDY4228690.1 helix-turn-helix domain-containing protein [Prevotella sp.]